MFHKSSKVDDLFSLVSDGDRLPGNGALLKMPDSELRRPRVLNVQECSRGDWAPGVDSIRPEPRQVWHLWVGGEPAQVCWDEWWVSEMPCRCHESWVTMGTKERVGFHQPPLDTQADLNTHLQLQPVLSLDALTLSWYHKRLWAYIKGFEMKNCEHLLLQSPRVLLLECKRLWLIPPSLVQKKRVFWIPAAWRSRIPWCFSQ